jgi:gluconate 2-dehydrogenase gamma chain
VNIGPSSRRLFLKHGALGLSGAVLLNLVPSALQAAHQSAKAAAASGEGFVFFSPGEAADVKAFADQIFPTDETPGASEANVVYFIDHVLKSSDHDAGDQFRHCISRLNENSAQLFPGTTQFSSLTRERQAEVITRFQTFVRKRRSDVVRGMFGDGTNYFDTMRTYVIAGFLSDPVDGGNKDMVGWELIGFDGMSAHEPPFGFYDSEVLKNGGNK